MGNQKAKGENHALASYQYFDFIPEHSFRPFAFCLLPFAF